MALPKGEKVFINHPVDGEELGGGEELGSGEEPVVPGWGVPTQLEGNGSELSHEPCQGVCPPEAPLGPSSHWDCSPHTAQLPV